MFENTEDPEFDKVEKRILERAEFWISEIAKNFVLFLSEDKLRGFYNIYTTRVRGNCIPFESYMHDVIPSIERYIELFKFGNDFLRTKAYTPWKIIKEKKQEKKKIYEIYQELISAAGKYNSPEEQEDSGVDLNGVKDKVNITLNP